MINNVYYKVLHLFLGKKIRKKVQMDLDLLPNEILMTIISYLVVKDAKEMSLTSKKMHSLTLSRIWSKPRFKSEILSMTSEI